MKKYIITWQYGQQGESARVIEAESLEQAERFAYEAWREDAENYADYNAVVYTEHRAEMIGDILEDDTE